MEREILCNFQNNIREKIGEENMALIADDLGIIITENENTINDLETKDIEINQLKTHNKQLIASNGNLLQQIPMGTNDKKEETKEEEEKEINFKDLFNEKGKFI